MSKKILVISSTFTGHGHKSITEALNDHIHNFPGATMHVIDGFNLGGNLGLRIGKMYGSITRTAKDVWKIIWDISYNKPSIINDFTELAIRENFLKLLKSVKPDLILSVHSNFNTPVINILEENNIKIPLVTLIADIISISPLWADPRADYIICPTIESKYKCLEFGVPETKLPVMGFPIRKRFTDHIGENNNTNDYTHDRPLECLIMSGGEGVGNMSRIARILLNNFNCRVKIIAGRNAILKRRLELTLGEKYGDKVEIFGFVDNVQDLMVSSDIAFTRGSPNTALEAVVCNVPLVITGALPGQEEGNPGYIQKYNLGVVCNETRKLKATVSELLANDAQKLNSIKQSQREYRNPDIAKNILAFLLGIESKAEVDFDSIKPVPRFKGLAEFELAMQTFSRAGRTFRERIGSKTLLKYRDRLRNRK